MTEPEQVLRNYREALRKLYGDEIADKSNLYYDSSWYYISVARRYPDGSCGASSVTEAHRKKHVIELTNNLLNRLNPKKERQDGKTKECRNAPVG